MALQAVEREVQQAPHQRLQPQLLRAWPRPHRRPCRLMATTSWRTRPLTRSPSRLASRSVIGRSGRTLLQLRLPVILELGSLRNHLRSPEL